MGAWGTGPFDNDDAADFVDEIVQLSLDDAHQQVDQACRLPSGRVDYRRGARAVAAAAIVAACLDSAGDLPLEARDLVERLGGDLNGDALRAAHGAITRVGQGDSEWNELWLDVEMWAAARDVVRNIQARLASDARVSEHRQPGQDALF